ncbi:hypothetical protein BpHYR1_045672, partial [Brachionus plicatilis]
TQLFGFPFSYTFDKLYPFDRFRQIYSIPIVAHTCSCSFTNSSPRSVHKVRIYRRPLLAKNFKFFTLESDNRDIVCFFCHRKQAFFIN